MGVRAMDRMWPFKPPFGYEKIDVSDGFVYRIRDFADNPVARSHVEENAALIVEALNRMSAPRGSAKNG